MRKRPTAIGPLVVLAAAALVAFLIGPLQEPFYGDPQRRLATFLTAWVLAIVLLATVGPARWYSASVLYLIVFGAFHGGLLLAAAENSAALARIPSGWTISPFMPDATRLATAGMLAFALTVVAVEKLGPAGHDPGRPAGTDEPAEHRRLVGVAGLFVQGAGLLLFAVKIQGAGWIRSLTLGYTAFLKAAPEGLLLSYAGAFVGIGTILAIVAGGRYRAAGWLAFGAYAAVAFPLGLRGEVLFPLAVLFALEVRRGLRPRPIPAVAAGAALLILISAVRQTRQSGVSALFAGHWKMSPFDALTEMGSSLRPCVEVVGWHGAGEPFRNGVTFIAIPLRIVERIRTPGTGPPMYDNRLFDHEIATRVGMIGGSPIAEGYHNFGLPGVVGVMVVLGLVVGVLERRASTVFSDAALGVVLVPVFVEIRNSSAHLIPHIVIGLTVLWIARLCVTRTAPPHRHQSSPARTEVDARSSREA